MSEEQQPEPEPEPETGTGPVTPEPPEPEPDPDPEPETPPPPPAGNTIAWEPQTWYSITYACRTPGCRNENIVRAAPMFYSNDGKAKNIRVVDGADDACKKDCSILTAERLDPQPVEE